MLFLCVAVPQDYCRLGISPPVSVRYAFMPLLCTFLRFQSDLGHVLTLVVVTLIHHEMPSFISSFPFSTCLSSLVFSSGLLLYESYISFGSLELLQLSRWDFIYGFRGSKVRSWMADFTCPFVDFGCSFMLFRVLLLVC